MFRIYRTASKKLFTQVTERIFGAPLQWLESTSHGEILQRCDPDIRSLDENLAYALSAFIGLASQLITVLWSRYVVGPVKKLRIVPSEYANIDIVPRFPGTARLT